MSDFFAKSETQQQREAKFETRAAVKRLAAFAIFVIAVTGLAALVLSAVHAQGNGPLNTQDKYSLVSPGGIAFSDFRGYEDWADRLFCPPRRHTEGNRRQSEDDRGVQDGHSRQRPAFSGGLQDRKAPVEAEEEHGGPIRRGRAGFLHPGFRDGKGQQEISEKQRRVGICGVQLRSRNGHVYRRPEKPLGLRKRVPYGRKSEGLHLPPVREALNRDCPVVVRATPFNCGPNSGLAGLWRAIILAGRRIELEAIFGFA